MSDHTESQTEGAAARKQSVGARAPSTNTKVRASVWLLILGGLLFILHGLGSIYRAYLSSGFELGVERLDGLTATELAGTHPELASYIGHVQVSFGGLLIATGLAITALAWFGVRREQRWAFATALGVPLIFAMFTIPIHQTVHFDFHFLMHLGPAGIGVALFVVGGILGYLGLRDIERVSSSPHRARSNES